MKDDAYATLYILHNYVSWSLVEVAPEVDILLVEGSQLLSPVKDSPPEVDILLVEGSRLLFPVKDSPPAGGSQAGGAGAGQGSQAGAGKDNRVGAGQDTWWKG